MLIEILIKEDKLESVEHDITYRFSGVFKNKAPIEAIIKWDEKEQGFVEIGTFGDFEIELLVDGEVFAKGNLLVGPSASCIVEVTENFLTGIKIDDIICLVSKPTYEGSDIKYFLLMQNIRYYGHIGVTAVILYNKKDIKLLRDEGYDVRLLVPSCEENIMLIERIRKIIY